MSLFNQSLLIIHKNRGKFYMRVRIQSSALLLEPMRRRGK